MFKKKILRVKLHKAPHWQAAQCLSRRGKIWPWPLGLVGGIIVSSDMVLETISFTWITSWVKDRYFLHLHYLDLWVMIHYILIRQHYYKKKYSQGLVKRHKLSHRSGLQKLAWLALLLSCCVTLNKPLYCSGLLFSLTTILWGIIYHLENNTSINTMNTELR